MYVLAWIIVGVLITLALVVAAGISLAAGLVSAPWYGTPADAAPPIDGE